MKDLIPILLLLGLSTTLSAQVNVLDIKEYTISANIDLVNDQLNDLKSSGQATMSLRNDELTISYPLNRNAAESFYNINLAISLDGNTLSLLEENIVGFIGDRMSAEKDGTQTINWIGLVETYQQLKGLLEVKVTVEQYELLDCSNPPTFTSKQKKPFYFAAGTGLLAIGAGQYFKYQSDNIYEKEYLTAESLAEATPIYDEANANHHAYLILTYAGAAILVGDAIWYLVKKGKHNRDLKLFEKACGGYTFTVNPMIELPAGTSINASTGIRLRCSF